MDRNKTECLMQQNILEHNAQINDHFKFKTSCKSHKPELLSFAVSVRKRNRARQKRKKKNLHRKITSNLIYFLSLLVYSGLNSSCITAVSLLSTKPSPMAQLPQCLLCLRWVSKAFSFHTSFTACCCDFRKSVGFYQANK